MSVTQESSAVIPAAEMVEGPYYGHGGPLRSDIREGKPGFELDLEIRLVDAKTGEPLSRLKMDLWHADATGHYSGYSGDPDVQPENVMTQKPVNDEKFLRGSQISDDDGIVQFLTIYPGWYATRTPHIHVKVFKGDTCLLTTQLYLPEAVSDDVYATPSYSEGRKADQDTRNATDTVIALTQAPIDGCWIELTRTGDRFAGKSVLGIDLDAVSMPFDPPPDFRPPIGGIPHSHKVR